MRAAAGGQGGALTCSNSSVMVLGSSCLWNHIMYLVWNRHDCFFRALAARYCAFVPWGGRTELGISGGEGHRTDPGPAIDRGGAGWSRGRGAGAQNIPLLVSRKLLSEKL